MKPLDDTIPQSILAIAPAPDRCYSLAEYLDHLIDARPDLALPVLAYADHDDLAELVLTRLWSRGRIIDREILAAITAHPEADLWIAVSVLLRIFPAPNSGPDIRALAADVVGRVNSGGLRLRYSETPVICARSLEIYGKLSADHPDLQISAAVLESANNHAAWIERGRAPGRGYAMFDGRAVLAASRKELD